VTTRALDDVLAETVTFIDLALEAEALDAEHLARWQRRLTPGVAALVLFGDGPWPAADEERAFHVLSSYLPTADIRSGAYGGAQVDRLEDFPQQAQFRLVEELRRLEKTLTPLERLGLLYEADPRLTHIANAALDRFRHDREKERRRAGKARFTLLADVAAKKRRDHNQKTDIADTRGDEEVVISGVAMPEVLVPPEAIEAWILRRFRHTKAQRQILRALVYRDDLDPRDPGFVGAWAEVSGYARETVSRYRSKLADTIQDARTFLE
jgi:hypothetical protein